MLKQLKTKIVLITMGIVVGMLLVIFSLVYHFTATNLQEQSNSMVQTLLLSSSTQSPQLPLPHFTLEINSWGGVHAYGNTHYDLSNDDFLKSLIQAVQQNGSRRGVLPKYSLQYGVSTSFAEQKIVFVDISSQQAALHSLVQISVLIGVIGSGAFLVLTILFACWAVKPVEQAWQQQRQFVSDASHELKTPLTVIMSNAELLQTEDFDEADKRRFSQNILTMSRQMRGLVAGMLELARVDNGQVAARFQEVKLSELTAQWALPFEPVLFEKGITLDCQIAPNIRLMGSESHLHQVVDILLDNAAKYSAKGIVQLTLARQGRSHCLLSVSNPGTPIPQEALPHIFERFYRVDEARARDGSFGLGLSIAKTIVEDHKGKIWADSNQSGSCFFVQLPCL